MNPQAPLKRLVLRAVLRHVSPMMIRVLGCARLPASMKSSAAFWVGMVWAASFAFTYRSSTVFTAEQVQATAGISAAATGKVSLHLRGDRALGMGVTASGSGRRGGGR